MDDVWTTRDLPVLESVVRRMDVSAAPTLGATDVCDDTGFSLEVVGQSFRALDRAGYITAVGDYDFDFPLEVTSVGDRAYRAVNAWPSPESLAAQVEAALRAAAASEQDQDKKTRLQAIVGAIGGVGRDVFTAVLTNVLTGKLGGG